MMDRFCSQAIAKELGLVPKKGTVRSNGHWSQFISYHKNATVLLASTAVLCI